MKSVLQWLKFWYCILFQLVAPKEGDDLLKDSAVLTHKDGFSWNWNVVRAVLKVILWVYCKSGTICSIRIYAITVTEHARYVCCLYQFRNICQPKTVMCCALILSSDSSFLQMLNILYIHKVQMLSPDFPVEMSCGVLFHGNPPSTPHVCMYSLSPLAAATRRNWWEQYFLCEPCRGRVAIAV